jgi:hypothetical protein
MWTPSLDQYEATSKRCVLTKEKQIRESVDSLQLEELQDMAPIVSAT